MDDVPLFPGYKPPAVEDLSAGQRLTRRQQEQVTAGVHPLTGGPLHPLASRHRDRDAPATDPFTCGSCWHRTLMGYHGKRYAKCVQGAESDTESTMGRLPRVTHGPASDVRAWWPACPEYVPGDSGLSPDAARHVPS